MSESRQRLRPWLEGQLNSQMIPGLVWLPNEKGVVDKVKFRIPWKHGGKHDWTPDQGRVWKEWAVHTGKYRPGVDEEAFAKWKTNLRCALNKASDIQEVTDESQREADEPFKVYRFLPRKDKGHHPVHKREYTHNENLFGGGRADLPEMSHLPAQVADYTSSLSSRGSSIQSIWSNPSTGGMPMSMGSMTSENGGRIPSDLAGLNSGSLQEMRMSSLENERLKAEVMDCDENDSSQSSDGHLNSFQVGTSAAMMRAQQQQQHQQQQQPLIIKQEIDERAHTQFNMNGEGPPANTGIFSEPAFLHMGDNSQPIAHQTPVYVTHSPHNAIVTDAASTMGNGFGGFVNTVVTSPSQFSSNASSPLDFRTQPIGEPNCIYPPVASPPSFAGTSPTPSPQIGSVSSQPSPHSTYSQMSQSQSPSSVFTNQSPAAFSPVHEPHQNGVGGEYASRVANQLAGLDVHDANRVDVRSEDILAPPLDNGYFLPLPTKFISEVDIGHKCIDKPEECSMMVRVMYKGNGGQKLIQEFHVTEPEGCMISANPITAREGAMLDEAGLGVIKEAVYDHKHGRLQIALPEWPRSGNMKLDREVDNLLKNTGRGIVIECKKGDIYAKRLCKTSVYFATHFEDEKCRKIDRHEDAQMQVKIFDYYNQFEPAVRHYADSVKLHQKCEVKHPNPDVYLFVGQNGTPSNAHTRYVVVKITSCKASKILKAMEKEAYASIDVSTSNSFDKLDHNIRKGLGTG